MKIHESQAKVILAKYGVPVPRGEVVFKKGMKHARWRSAWALRWWW